MGLNGKAGCQAVSPRAPVLDVGGVSGRMRETRDSLLLSPHPGGSGVVCVAKAGRGRKGRRVTPRDDYFSDNRSADNISSHWEREPPSLKRNLGSVLSNQEAVTGVGGGGEKSHPGFSLSNSWVETPAA